MTPEAITVSAMLANSQSANAAGKQDHGKILTAFFIYGRFLMIVYYALVHLADDDCHTIQFPDLPDLKVITDRAEDIIIDATQALRAHAKEVALLNPSDFKTMIGYSDVQKALQEGAFLICTPFVKDESEDEDLDDDDSQILKLELSISRSGMSGKVIFGFGK